MKIKHVKLFMMYHKSGKLWRGFNQCFCWGFKTHQYKLNTCTSMTHIQITKFKFYQYQVRAILLMLPDNTILHIANNKVCIAVVSSQEK